jgi:hypothetical protein
MLLSISTTHALPNRATQLFQLLPPGPNQFAGAGGANVDGDFKTAVAGGGSFYLEGVGADGSTANSAGLDKGDMKLYTATGGTLIGQALVECATCHDPHSENTTFLRNTQGNENSATCLSCHTK